MGRGLDSQFRKEAGTRSRFALMVVWMFMLVSLFFVFARPGPLPVLGESRGTTLSE